MLRDVKNDEWRLGSEDEVMQSLEVSWPTLRQALRLLEQEQLISVRRCRRRPLRPTEEGVIHTASVYLRAGGNSYGRFHRHPVAGHPLRSPRGPALRSGGPPSANRGPPNGNWGDSVVTDLPGSSRSEEHTSELQSLMRISYAVCCLKN